MNEELKIILSADVGGFVDGVLKVNRSIGELETELKQFQKEIKTLKGDEFNVMSDKIKTLKANISALKSAGSSSIPPLADDLKKIAAPAGNAGFALSNLGRVASDLPFGFIAIQNNLSPLLESFQGLKKESGSTGGALKALGGSLLGAGGLGFAFAAIPAIITSVIQKYGSLGNALDAFTTKNQAAFDAQQTFNAELEKGGGTTGAEIATIDVLVKKLSDLKEPYKARQEAYNLLKKIQPDILEGLSKENVLSGQAIGLLITNANTRKSLIADKVKQGAIEKVLDENASKRLDAEVKLTNATIARNKAEKELSTRQTQIAEDAKKRGDSEATIASLINDYARKEIINLQVKTAALAKAQTEFDKYNKIQSDYTGLLSPLLTKQATENQLRIDNAAATAAAAAEAAKLADANARNAAEVEKSNKATEKQNLSLNESLRIAQAASAKAGGIQKPLEAGYDPLASMQGAVTSFKGNMISAEMQNQIDKTAEAEAAYKKYAETISGLVAPAIDSFFAGIESGKDAFTALGDSIKALVIDLVKAIIKATILSAITGAIGGGAGAGVFGVITNLLGGGLGKSMAPSFGGGVSAGGFSLNGQVTFIQRGGDLVGVLNNSNKMINRVG